MVILNIYVYWLMTVIIIQYIIKENESISLSIPSKSWIFKIIKTSSDDNLYIVIISIYYIILYYICKAKFTRLDETAKIIIKWPKKKKSPTIFCGVSACAFRRQYNNIFLIIPDPATIIFAYYRYLYEHKYIVCQ